MKYRQVRMVNKMEKKYYKYIHLLWRNEEKFNGEVVKLINTQFDMNNHLFVTPHKEVYNKLKVEYKNIHYDPNRHNLFNFYARRCDYIISHSTKSLFSVIQIKNKNCKKIILRYWGGSLSGFKNIEKSNIMNYIKRLINNFFQKKVKKFACIGISNVIDEIDLKKTYKSIPLYILPYTLPDLYEYIQNVNKEHYIDYDDSLNILLGHRAGREGNHIEIYNTLKKFKNNRINIYIPISYGDKEYARKLKENIVSIDKIRIIFIDEFLAPKKYVDFLNRIHIGIFDGTESYALGNIQILLSLKKTIYLNRCGILCEGFNRENVPFGFIDEINNINFSEFSKRLIYDDETIKNLCIQNRKFIIDKWEELFDKYG